MKRILLFLLFIAVASTACKKPKKAQGPVTMNTLIGNWTDQLPLSSSMIPDTYSFRTDGSWSNFAGMPMQGTYEINAGSTVSRIDMTLRETGNPTPWRIYIEITSQDRMVVTYPSSTAGRPFVRVP